MRFYYSLNEHLRRKFGCRVQKLSVHCGFSCPNRDGTVGYGGCIFCNDKSLYNETEPGDIKSQILKGMERAKRKYRAEKFIVYFQSNTNTYAEPEHLFRLYSEALTFPDVVGIAIGTRPDCVKNDILDMLEELDRRTYLWMEYGLQSTSDETLRLLNRGHTLEDFTDAVMRTQQRNIEVCAHIILGIPGEGRENMIKTADYLGKIGIDGVKIHALHVLRDTELEKWYNNNQLDLIGMEDYALMVVEFLERLPPWVVIHRLTGEAPERFLVAPEWVRNKSAVLMRIRQLMKEKNTCQAKHFPHWLKRAYKGGT